MLRAVQDQDREQRGIVCAESSAGSGKSKGGLFVLRAVQDQEVLFLSAPSEGCSGLTSPLCVQQKHVLGCSATELGK